MNTVFLQIYQRSYSIIMIAERRSVKLLIINNIASGYGEGAIYDFIRAFVTDGDEICMRSTNGDTDIRTMLDDATDFDAVVASGGDGTVTTVSYQLRNSGIPILPFPAGTSNLLALNLASPVEPHALSKLARNMRTLDFDMGELEVEGQTFGFDIIAGAGYDAVIMKNAIPSKKFLGPMAYFSAAVTNPMPQTSKFTLNLDGKTIESEGLGVLMVNFAKIQYDISITHDNEPRDGKLDVVILKARTAFELIPALIAGLLDREGEFPERSDALETYRAHEVEVIANPPMNIQYDGEPTQLSTPFKARILKGATRFIVSDEGYEMYT